jgi:dCMP deaminase
MSEKRGGDWWDRFFFGLAAYVASASKDPSTKTGVVLVDAKRRVVGTGYNGFPRGVEDTDERLNDRPTKYKLVVHAEANAILNATADLPGATAYVFPWPPCASCAGLLIQAGVARVVAPAPTPEQVKRWGADFDLMRSMFLEAGVNLVEVGGEWTDPR